jgi:betaine lipid synthase
MELARNLCNDVQVLKSIWFGKITGSTHKERLESFYGPQAHCYDHFRARFLHGRTGLLRECARAMQRLSDRNDLVWVDLGGGTGQNVETMANFCDLSLFKKIVVVDICGPLCEIARAKVAKQGWSNVEVVEADVCDYEPDQTLATLVTFSYSLSMIPPFMNALDKAASFLDPTVGVLGVADFFTSLKHDKPDRQHGYLTRWFWRSIFDLDNIDLGPERRQYMDYNCETVYEENRTGHIPYVPFLQVPYYIWLGRPKHQ